MITTGPGPVPRLDGLNLIFGRVTSGMTTVAAAAAVPSFQPDARSQQLNAFAKFIGDDRADKVRGGARALAAGMGAQGARGKRRATAPRISSANCAGPRSIIFATSAHPPMQLCTQVRRRYGRPLKAIVITSAGVVGETKAAAAPVQRQETALT